MPSKKLSKFEMEALEKRARGRAAWGMYGAYVEQQNVKQECENLRHKLQRNGCGESEIKKEVEKLKKSKESNFLRIG